MLMRCGARSGPGGWRWRAMAAQVACRGGLDCRLQAGHGEERTRNISPMSVTLEALKLSGWLNFRASCREPEGGVRCGARCGPRCGPGGREAAGDRAHAACRGGVYCSLGARHRDERTRNMLFMAVTLEVLKLSCWLNADAPCRTEGIRWAYDGHIMGI